MNDDCRCGHDREFHRHYRPGTDCGACGEACTRFTPAVPAWRRLFGAPVRTRLASA